ncbi:MBL fold metallo-hydrolase [Gammaproteobacteria bacterium]|nr:MBL fold metallo-hydrolase [Gammaproteobacteria bacterium]
MIYKNILGLLFCLFLLSCAPQDNEIEIPKTSQVENLIEHSKEFERKIYSYSTPGGKIHVAIGFGIANSIMVEGDGGNIIIDSSDSTYEAEEIYKLFKQKNSNPIKAIIYTHNHGDHTFGTAYYLTTQKERPKIIAHQSTDYYMQRILGIINPIISTRSTRMFGTALPEDDVINVGIGKSLNISKSPFGYVSPDTTFEDELKINIAGVNIELYHAPGETNDQLFVWLPNHKSLMPGDNIYKTFPNLYTIRGTTHRDVMGWVSSLDHMRSFNSEYVFPSHTKPIVGLEVISDTFILYRDAIQFVHDQTVRLMNQGLYPDQIIELVDLPESIKKSPFLNEFYGTVRWSVKSIYNGYLGWFNGNPAELDPLSRKEEAQKFANLVGGEEALFLAFQNAVNDKEMQWALELSDRLMALNFSIAEVESLRREALLYIGTRSSNPNKRNYFLTSALELSDSFVSFEETERTSEGVKEISIDTIFSILSVRLNPEKVINKNMNVCFYFSSGLRKTISIRNQVAAISNEITNLCAISVKATELNFKMAISGLANPVMALASGDIEVDGSNTDFLQFLTYFR